MRVCVLLQVKEWIARHRSKLCNPVLQCLADNEQRGRHPEAVVQRPGLLKEPWRDVTLANPLHVVAASVAS